jgi:hypothetical protein
MNDHKVIGFVSIRKDKSGIFTDGPACVIAGSDEQMRGYILTEAPSSLDECEIKKTRLGEVIRGLGLGAEYQFDNISFKRFQEAIKEESFFSKLKITEKKKEQYGLIFNNVVLATS